MNMQVVKGISRKEAASYGEYSGKTEEMSVYQLCTAVQEISERVRRDYATGKLNELLLCESLSASLRQATNKLIERIILEAENDTLDKKSKSKRL